MSYEFLKNKEGTKGIRVAAFRNHSLLSAISYSMFIIIYVYLDVVKSFRVMLGACFSPLKASNIRCGDSFSASKVLR
jgi:hypothetical protein